MTERKHVLGGTDAANLIGVGFKSPAWLYMKLRGEVEDDFVPSNATDGGKLFEEHVAVPLAKKQLGMQLERPERMTFQLPDEPRIGCSLDYEVVPKIPPGTALEVVDGDDIPPVTMEPAEIKATFSKRMWDEGDKVPPTVMAQVQHDMAVMRRCGVVVPVFHILAFMNWEFVPFDVEEDQEVGDVLIDAARDMLECVDEGREPDVKNAEQARLIFAGKRDEVYVCTDEDVALLNQLRQAKRAKGVCEEQEKRILDALLPSVGDATELVTEAGELLATWRPNKLFDEAAFVEAHPDLAPRYQKGVSVTKLRKDHPSLAQAFSREPVNGAEATRPFKLNKKFAEGE